MIEVPLVWLLSGEYNWGSPCYFGEWRTQNGASRLSKMEKSSVKFLGHKNRHAKMADRSADHSLERKKYEQRNKNLLTHLQANKTSTEHLHNQQKIIISSLYLEKSQFSRLPSRTIIPSFYYYFRCCFNNFPQKKIIKLFIVFHKIINF